MRQLVSSGAKDGAQDRVEPRQRPVFGKCRGDRRVDPFQINCDAAHDIGEQRYVGLAILVTIYFVAKPVSNKLAHYRFGIGRSVKLELVQSLNRCEPRDAPPPTTASRITASGFVRNRRLSGRLQLYAVVRLSPR
jgi:hypothetical protein